MRLHIYQDYWAANWAESGTDNLGEVQLIDARGHLDTAHRALYALAAATAEHGDDAGWYAGEVVLCLSPSQRREVGDLRARVWKGRWGTQHARDVAGWLFAAAGGYRPGHPESGYNKDHCEARDKSHPSGANRALVDYLPEGVAALPARFPRVACYQGTATRLVEQLPERLDNVIAYLDPPYSGTTGYKFGDCPREEVLRLALDLHRRGATVAISEAVRLDRELGDGWTAVQIDGERNGQKRTFSVQQSEWVTMNRAPVKIPGQQQGLFGGAG